MTSLNPPACPHLDAILERVIYEHCNPDTDAEQAWVDALFVSLRAALLAEGRIHAPDENSVTQWEPFLAIPLSSGEDHTEKPAP